MHASISGAAGSDLPLTGTRSKGRLLRILGVGFGIAVIVGSTIGSGILLTPGYIAAQLRNPWLDTAAWVMGGIFALFCTLSVVELGTMLPQSGGWFVFSRRAFGPYGGFLVGCCDWTMQMAAMAYLAAAFGEFVAEFEPGWRAHQKLAAVACLVVLMALNWLGLRWGSRAQEITSLVKALALVAFVAACFTVSPHAAAAAGPAPQSLFHLAPLAVLVATIAALQPIIATYDGWYGAIYFAEEDEDPVRNLPRSSIAGVLACAAIFILVNAALLHVLSLGGLAASRLPAADAAALIFGARGREIILLISMVTAISTINACLLIAPRILFAMGRAGLMPAWMADVNRGGTPGAALLVGSLVSIALVLTGSFDTIVAVTAILYVAVYLSGFLSLFVLRIKEPDLPRPFKMWGYPWTNLGITLGAGGFLIAAIVGDLRHALFALVVMALTYPLYLAMRKMRPAQAANCAPATPTLSVDEDQPTRS